MNIKMFKKVLMFTVLFAFSLILPASTLAAGPASVNLGTAGNFVILSKTGITTTGTTSVVGDIGVSPAEATYITGFGLTLPAASAFSTSSLVTGKVYAPSYAVPTPANLTTAVSDMETAYTDAMGRTNPTATELGAGNIGGMTLAPGLYKWGTGVTIPTNVTLSGGANDVWIFQIAQNLNVSSAVNVVLSGGAQASNIFWVVAGQATLGTTSVINGNILSQTAIVLNTGATLNGRALAQSAVTLDSNSVIVPTTSSGDSNSSTTDTTSTTTTTASNTSNNSSTDTTSTTTTTSSNNSNNSSTDNTTTVAPITGCSSGNRYNTSTGALCVSAVAQAAIAGCGNRTTGFSTTIGGKSCVGNVVSAAATSGTYNFGSVTLRNGSQGNAVMELQRFLNAKLNLGLVIDGKLGPKTIAVIKKWQLDNGLVSDGLVGAKTKARMNAMVQ